MIVARKRKSFGQLLRETRLEKGFGLRKFAEMAGVSPTYMSQVEQDNCDPPTAERVKRMAELLGANSDEWISLAGRLPDDLEGIVHRQPTEMPQLLREANGLSAEQLRQIREQIRQMKSGGQS
jgi:HTH-type transcriptional regulator, competence development regulator